MSTKFDLSNDNGSTSNFFDVLSLSSFSHSSIIKKKEKHKRSLVTDNDGRYSTSLSFFTMIIGQLRVNIKLLQSAFFFFLSNRSFSFSFFFLPYIEIYDIIVSAERKYRTTMFINSVPAKRKKETWMKIYSLLSTYVHICY